MYTSVASELDSPAGHLDQFCLNQVDLTQTHLYPDLKIFRHHVHCKLQLKRPVMVEQFQD